MTRIYVETHFAGGLASMGVPPGDNHNELTQSYTLPAYCYTFAIVDSGYRCLTLTDFTDVICRLTIDKQQWSVIDNRDHKFKLSISRSSGPVCVKMEDNMGWWYIND